MPDDPAGSTPRRQPVFNLPPIVVATLALLLAIHGLRQIIPPDWDDALFVHLALVPGRLTYGVAPDRVVGAMLDLAARGPRGVQEAQAGRYYLGTGSPQPWTTLTYALLHGSWSHVGLNDVWLLAFGTPVARRFGAARFVAFMLAGALAGALVQWAAYPLDLMPVVGASAAVSACMGAALRFVFQREDAAAGEAPLTRPARPLLDALADRRALVFLVAWFATNLVVGLGSVSLGLSDGPVAWEAHIGGFLLGLLAFRAFDPIRGASPSGEAQQRAE